MMFLSVLMLACTTVADAPDADPRAIFDRCCTYYAGLQGFAVTMHYTPPATPLVDPAMAKEHRLDFSGAKPDKLRITQHIPGIGAMEIISDGQELVMALPAQSVYSKHPAPSTMAQARQDIQLGGVVDGMTDMCFNLIGSDPAGDMIADSQRLTSEGTTTVGETTCDLLRLHPKKSAFVPDGMSVDLLIAKSEQPWVLGYNLNLPAMEEQGILEPVIIEIRARDWKALDATDDAFTYAAGDAVLVDNIAEALRKSTRRTAPPPPADITPPGTAP